LSVIGDFLRIFVEIVTKEDYKQDYWEFSAAAAMNTRTRTILSTTLLLAAGFLALYSLAGKGGVPMVLDRNRQIRELREQNAELQRSIELKKERIKNLSENRSDQDLEIRRELRLLKKKETTFVLPEQKK
jgi:cell division protein FtsB